MHASKEVSETCRFGLEKEMTLSKRIIRLGISGLAMAATLVGGMAGMANASVLNSEGQAATSATPNASAQYTRLWEVPQNKVYDNDPWPLQGKCFGESYAIYDSAANRVSVVSRATNTSAISGCRLQVRLTLRLSFSGYAFEQTVVSPIPTACSTTDYSCPSDPLPGLPGRGTGWDEFVQDFPAGMTLVDITNYTVERR